MATLMDGVYRLIMHLHPLPTTTSITPLSQTTLLILLFIIPLSLLLLHISRNHHQQPKPLPLPPSPPGGLPIIGHLRLVGALPHVSLRLLAAEHKHKHGGGLGLMLLRLGTVRNLVVSTPRAAEAVLRTHDSVFASRPAFKLVDDLGYGQSSSGHIAFAPYGERWRQVRKLVTTHLFTVKKVHSYHIARQHEVRLLMDRLREAAAAGEEVDMSEMVNAFSNDIVCHAVSGKFFRAEGRNKLFRELIEIDSVLAGGFSLENCFPGLANSVGRFTSWFMSNKAVEVHKRWDELLEKIICDHEGRRRAVDLRQRDTDVNEESVDFIDVILSLQQEYNIDRDHMKGILMDMFEAGTGTSSLVLDLAMVELMRNPDLMTKLQDEVRNKTPKGQEIVKEENLASMAYLKAVVKETLRLHPPLPLLLPHQSMEDCEVDGYTIPSGTRVIINAYAISRDPETWEKPDEFMPERFINGGSAVAVDFKGNNFEFTPFGAGRRMCPGLNFGLATIEILLANLVYCFDWELPSGMKREDIDMTEVFGVTVHRKDKLILVPKPHGALA